MKLEHPNQQISMNCPLPQPLLQPWILGDIPLKNRSVMAPMTRTRADNSEHLANDLMREYYAQRASAGLIISEGTWVSEEAICQMNVPGLYTIQQAEAWKKVTDGVHEKGGIIFAQLWHAGSVSHPDYQKEGKAPIAPSAVNPLLEVYTPKGKKRTVAPREMTLEDIARTVAAFENSAAMASRAGFDGIQIQAGFIYLLQQFHHATTNLRTDQFGGNVENRTRFLFEVLEAVLKVWPSERVGVKTGPMMTEQGVFKAIESTLRTHEYIFDRLNSYNLSHVMLMGEPAGRGLNGADVSATPLAHLKGEAIFRYFRRGYRGNLILSTGINHSRANQLLEEGVGDLIAFGREFISSPDLVERFARHEALNEQRPESFYGVGPVGYTDYPFLEITQNAEASMSQRKKI